ncbi:cupin domain-containing protein [Methylobacterium sp. WSM2598]|uniref:cupin domain-containing protein n=1 Tax=Methylobacterium sp. WSM2598 TaxID=398261 RepID=UPI00036DB286|nr:cupin domain-containing protein [Methylobacterium sp. WSM2598]
MAGTTITKISGETAPRGPQGERVLAAGQRVAMRLWDKEPPTDKKPVVARDYETVGYVVAGRAELEISGRTVRLEPGDSWLVPAGAEHTYRVLETFTAVEATAPPARGA